MFQETTEELQEEPKMKEIWNDLKTDSPEVTLNIRGCLYLILSRETQVEENYALHISRHIFFPLIFVLCDKTLENRENKNALTRFHADPVSHGVWFTIMKI